MGKNTLRGVTERPAWEEWLLCFFNGVARQSEDAASRAERLNRQLDRWRESVSRAGSGVALQMLDFLGTNPFITVRKAQAQLGVAYNTAAGALRRLVTLGVVKQVGDARRDRVFCAESLLKILEEPARLHVEQPTSSGK